MERPPTSAAKAASRSSLPPPRMPSPPESPDPAAAESGWQWRQQTPPLTLKTPRIDMSDQGLSSPATGSTPVAGVPASGHPVYTCPMHPEVQQDHPGACPKCGMALELETPATRVDNKEDGELLDMTRRFWIGAALTLPVFVLAMAHLIPALGRQPWVTGDASRWLQFALTAPVVCWAGWPFFQRGWR